MLTMTNLFVYFLLALCSSYKQSLAVQGGWSKWSVWSGWGKGLCSGNQRVKTRSCTNPVPTDGINCAGDHSISQKGSVDGGYSEWSQWSICTSPCGGSLVNRTRRCDSPPPSNNGLDCKGDEIQTKLDCVMPCPEGRIDGVWSPWSVWTSCPKTCSTTGSTHITRYRQCNMPPPMFGGKPCPGNATEEMFSCFESCPVNGGFGMWSSFTPCSRTCGSGFKTRSRLCNNPEPRGKNTKQCDGSFEDRKTCNLGSCQGHVDGKWSSWSSWTSCTESIYCNQGSRNRQRSCNNPSPSKHGEDCEGLEKEVKKCPTKNCRGPRRPSVAPVNKSHYLWKECGADRKYLADGTGGRTVPSKVFSYVKYYTEMFHHGYFATHEEKDDIKICFELYPVMTVEEVMKLVPSFKNAKQIPNYSKVDNSHSILGFSFTLKKTTLALREKSFGIDIVPEYIPAKNIHLTDVMFGYEDGKEKQGYFVTAEFRQFDPIVFKTRLFFNTKTEEFVLEGEVENLKLAALLQTFIHGQPSKEISVAIKALQNLNIWDYSLKSVALRCDLKATEALFRMTANATLFNSPLLYEIIYRHAKNDTKLAFGFSIHGVPFGSLIAKMLHFGTSNPVVQFFDKIGSQIKIGVVWSLFGKFKVDKEAGFQTETLKKVLKGKIPDNLVVTAQIKMPGSCDSDQFCEITKTLIGSDAAFHMKGIIKGDYFKVTGGIENVTFLGGISFDHLELFGEVNTTSGDKKMGFDVEVKIPVSSGSVQTDGDNSGKSLTFGGALEYTFGKANLDASLYMKGIWHKAFGLSWLNFGNLYLGVSIGEEFSIQLGGQVEIGDNCVREIDFAQKGHCLRVQAYFGYPAPEYFFGNISSLTVGKLIRMFGGSISLPSPIDESGYPDGLLIQYNAGLKKIDLSKANGPIITPGFRWKGTLDFLGFKVKADIITSTAEVSIEGETSPIDFLGIVLSRSQTERSLGPKFSFHYNRPSLEKAHSDPFFKAYFEGYLSVFKIGVYTCINFTKEQMEIQFSGNFMNLIKADLYISGTYSKKLGSGSFGVHVALDLNGITGAIEEARKKVNEVFEAGHRSMRDANRKLIEAKRKCKEDMKISCDSCHSMKCDEATANCKKFFGNVKKFFTGIGHAVSSWFGKRRRRRSLHCDRDSYYDLHVRSKRGLMSKIFCDGLVNGACKGVEALCEGSCQMVNFISQGLCNVLDVARGALMLVDKVSGWVNAAINFVMQIFLIHSVKLDFKLGTDIGFVVAAEADLTIFGKRGTHSFRLDFSSMAAIIDSVLHVKDKALDHYQKGVNQEKKEASVKGYDRPNPFADFDLSGRFNIEALSTRSKHRPGACLAVLSKTEGASIELVGCNSTDPKQLWSYTLKGSIVSTYSRKCLAFPNSIDGMLYQEECGKEDNRQAHECDVTKRSLKIRRSKLCATAERSSPNGPGTLTHLGSLKCVVPDSQNELVLRSNCKIKEAIFQLSDEGYITNNQKSHCIKAENNSPREGDSLELVRYHIGCHKFSFTKFGSIQHISSRLCIQITNLEMKPRESTKLILGRKCEFTSVESKKRHSPIADAQLVFAFVPYNNKIKMHECRGLLDHQDEQQFSILRDELRTVCSKFIQDNALFSKAEQSSVYRNGFARRAVDGNFDFHWDKGSCMSTQEEMDPWWRVDMGREVIVTDVIVLNRAQSNNQLKNIQAHIGNDLVVRKNPVCDERYAQAADGEAVTFQCHPGIPGKYAGIQMYGKGILSMCEVVVASRIVGFVDKCLFKNGGCQHICHNKCGGPVTCGCKHGYKLAYDGKNCLDVNECLVNNGGCRGDTKAFCTNYPGGFQCQCAKGYILKDNSEVECMDIDECGVKNGGCEQMCNNTDGGHMCTCRQGYERKPNDPHGCQNVNECLTKNGGCSHGCHDYDGGYYCTCNPGYQLMDDRKKCEEIYCSELEVPSYGKVSPDLCLKPHENIPVGTKCKFECVKGFERSTEIDISYLTCRVDGTWDYGTPSCRPIRCPILPRPSNGGITPARCHGINQDFNEYGQRCITYCKNGYQLQGPSVHYCQANRTWTSDHMNVSCVKKVEKKFLNCPNDIEAVLPSHYNWVTFGKRWHEPQTNILRDQMTTKPPSVGPNYKFHYGTTVVSYHAETDSGDHLSCTFMVMVSDHTPPVVKNCPSDIYKTSDFHRAVITWKEPSFTDNVGIREISNTTRKPGDIWYDGESMSLMYLATDLAGNINKCVFKVTYKSTVCPILRSRGMADVIEFEAKKRYAITCKPGYTLFGNFGLEGTIAVCVNGHYFIEQTLIGLHTPECVRYERSYLFRSCREGFVKFSYDDYFNDVVYYCASCPSGRYFDKKSKTCNYCKKGTYQSKQGEFQCEKCPKEKSTEKVGSNSKAQCLEHCPRGYFSESGLSITSRPCRPCPKGSFTHFTGSTECMQCPEHATTANVGSTDKSQCQTDVKITHVEPSKVVRTTVGSTVRLACYVVGYPTPDIQWDKRIPRNVPKNFETNEMHDGKLRFIGKSFVLHNVQAIDTDLYRCTVENRNGRAREIIQLTVCGCTNDTDCGDYRYCQNSSGCRSCQRYPDIGDSCAHRPCGQFMECKSFYHKTRPIHNRCVCAPGFRMRGGRRDCEDIDECYTSREKLCDQRCINTLGSYQCACYNGFELGADKKSCHNVRSCGVPNSQPFSEVHFTNTTIRSIAVYDCDPGYSLRGERERRCGSNGRWSGSAPQCIPGVCGARRIRHNYGTIHSPNYPYHYDNNEYCRWRIEAPHNKKVSIIFKSFNTEKYDHVKVFDGKFHHLLADLHESLSKAFQVTSQSNELDIKFISDHSITMRGFSASYHLTECGGYITHNGEIIQSPGYPNNYPPNVECVWQVNIRNESVVLKFEDFQTYDYYDSLEAWNSLDTLTSATSLGRVYGNSSRLVLVSDEVMYLKFTSNSRNSGRGFKGTISKYHT